MGDPLGVVYPFNLPAMAVHRRWGGLSLGGQGGAKVPRQGVEAPAAGASVSGPGGGHRLSGGRHLQPLPLFPILTGGEPF